MKMGIKIKNIVIIIFIALMSRVLAVFKSYLLRRVCIPKHKKIHWIFCAENSSEKIFLHPKNRHLQLHIVFFISIFIIFSLFAMDIRVDAIPSGTNITLINSSTINPPSPQSINAYAGNVSEMNIFGYSTTQSWQGFYGNVTGVVQLGDSASHVMYNWSNLNPKGEVYASVNNSVNWANVQCFNYTANGTYCSADNSRGGNTSLCGMNLSQLQTNYNISFDDVDTVNNTFELNNHELFYTGNLQFNSGQCKNMKVYNSTGAGTYDEVLLYDPSGRSVVFTSILQKNADGFDQHTHDFEMLVLENGHNGDVSTTPYYFYLELQ
jgi:hypothetical protein